MLSTVRAPSQAPMDIYMSKPQTVSSGHKLQYGYIPPRKPQFYGIEVNGSFMWKDWVPGREYTKQLTLKNVKFKSDTIEFNLPTTQAFTTVYPKKIKLGAGTSYSIPVTFRPLENVEYHDNITIKTKEGEFNVKLRAVLPSVNVSFPESVDFGMCAIHNFSQVNFELANIGDLPLSYQWDCIEPFAIEPLDGHVHPQQSILHTVTFKPKDALVYELDIPCNYGSDQSLSKTLTLKGVGKYPHILVSAHGASAQLTQDSIKAQVDFGLVAVGDVKEKWVDLHNLSPVKAPFKVEYMANFSRIDTVFTSPNVYGVVDPMTTISIPLLYTPKAVNSTDIDYITVFAPGNLSKSVIKCFGTSIGPVVMLSDTTIHFNIVDLGDQKQLSVSLVNISSSSATYQFCIDSTESVFKFNTESGEIPANEKIQIIVDFIPKSAINYYRRVSCLIHNQGPIFLDLLGTCHSDYIHPPLISSHHVSRYRKNIENRVSHYPPEQLKEMLAEDKIYFEEGGSLKMYKSDELNKENKLDPSTIEEHYDGGYHYPDDNETSHVSLDSSEADFGRCENMRMIENKEIYLTNHTRGKVVVNWMTDENRPFSVFPSTVEIPAEKTMSFQLSFKPSAPSQMYGSLLECYVFYKTLREFSLVDEKTLSPPWCLTLQCTGHTFMKTMETFLPRCTLTPDLVLFPPANQNESSFRTVLMTNHSHAPLLFNMTPEGNGVFGIKPTKGIVPVGGHRVFVLKAVPQEVRTTKHQLSVRLNDSDGNNQKVELFVPCETATILMDNEGDVFFKPTCIGSSSTVAFSFRNITRIPIRFEWKLLRKEAHILSVSPESGVIQPNELVTHYWTFSPNCESKVLSKPKLLVCGDNLPENKSGGKRKVYTVRVIGEGTRGVIHAQDSYINVGNIAVKSFASCKLHLLNNADCDLHFCLRSLEYVNYGTSDCEVIAEEESKSLMFDRYTGVLPARSNITVMATLKPPQSGDYQFAVSYDILTPQGEVIKTENNSNHLCHILMCGVFPYMVVTDIVCSGSSHGVSKRQTWSLFSVNKLNECLNSNPFSRELNYSLKTRPSYETMSDCSKSALDFNFNAAPVGTEPAVITLMLDNPGPVPTEWNFLMPCDLQLDLQYWMVTGEFTQKELKEMQIQSNHLFMIEPKRGRLEVGETQAVTLTYKHMIPGTDRLPVMLKLAKGREIMLNFIGVTVEKGRRYVHFPSNFFQFTPVPVGEKSTPIQIYELYNGGSVTLYYHLDLTPLDIIRQENFDQAIFECLDPVGEVAAGQTQQIRWRFMPVEVKTYVLDVPICIEGGDTAVISFMGIGYDQRAMGDTIAMTSIAAHGEDVPVTQKIEVDNQLAYLSNDRINMGNIALYSQCRRIVFVMNKSRDSVVSYMWSVASKADTRSLFIHPIHGKLQPGESNLCRVIFTALGEPTFHDLDLVCEIKNETENTKYEKEVSLWEKEHYRQCTEFVVTEDNPDADREDTPDLDVLVHPQSRQLKTLRACSGAKNDSQLIQKYRTLPPISLPTVDDWYTSKEKRDKFSNTLWEKPTPPLPYLIHLGVTARTHEVHDFQTNFSDQRKYFYVDSFLSKDHRSIQSPRRSARKRLRIISCKEQEKDMLTTVLGNVIRCLMDDANFKDGIFSLAEEPIPFFVQYTNRPHPHMPITVNKHMLTEVASLPIMLASGAQSLGKVAISSMDDACPDGDVKSGSNQPDTLTTSSPRVTAVSLSNERSSMMGLVKQFEEAKMHYDKQDIKKLSELGHMVESTLENSILNIMMEALTNETSLTNRLCFAALPPRFKSIKDCRFRGPNVTPKLTQSAGASLFPFS